MIVSLGRTDLVTEPLHARMLIAIVAMFLQQTCGSVGRVLPAVLAPLIILELHADPSWVGVYFGLVAIAALIGQLGSGGFIIRHGAIRMSQIALLFTGAGLAVAVLGGAVGFVLSALIGNGVAAVVDPNAAASWKTHFRHAHAARDLIGVATWCGCRWQSRHGRPQRQS